MWARADTYMSDMCLKFGPTVKARIEQVALLEENVHCAMDSESTFDEEGFASLIRNKPLLVPFSDARPDAGVMCVVQSVAQYMVGNLRSLFENNSGKGGYEQTWAAYQCELGLEELFFGHPFSTHDCQYSVSLGSLTCVRGFAALAPVSSASAGIAPPPPTV